MITREIFTALALSFEGVEEKAHFEGIGFRVPGKRMFATYWEGKKTANLFFTREEQKVFCEIDAQNIYPVPNKWGEKGATTFELAHVSQEILREALLSAYTSILSPKK